MRSLPRIRAAIYGQPWLITEPWFETICSVFENAVQNPRLQNEDDADPLPNSETPDPEEPDKPDYEIRRGVAILRLEGPLFPKANVFTRLSRATSYEEFSFMLADARQRSGVSAILNLVDSPGGSVSGCFECARDVFTARTDPKPIISLAHGSCCSGAYAIASQADQFFCTEGSLVGSIGVLFRQDNFDRAEKNAGIDPLILRSHELKSIGEGPHTPNQIDALKRLLNDITKLFASTVQRARPSLDIAAVSTGESWLGQKAVDLGLVDGLSTLDEVIDRFGKSK